MLMTKSYIHGKEEEIKAGETYYLGQLVEGGECSRPDFEDILLSGSFAMWDENEKQTYIIVFTTDDIQEDILDTLVKVKEIF